MNVVTLPRTLVMKLLHMAQVEPGAGVITHTPSGEFALVPLVDGAFDEKLDVFAFYRTTSNAAPAAEDVARWHKRTGLFLSVSADTEGVLQLRGWELGTSGLQPIELALADEGDLTQRVGTSRKT